MASQCQIAMIDSGEENLRNQLVYKYQQLISKVLTLLLATSVILSPVLMLLIPKMEFMFGSTTQALANNVASTINSNLPIATLANALATSQQQQQLLNSNNQHHQLQNYQLQQPLQQQWKISECGPECDGPLIGFVARFSMLFIAYWTIFMRPQTVIMPRVDFHKCFIVAFGFFLTLAYWLFFLFRVFDKRYNDYELSYLTVILFASSMLDSLIILHYLAIILLELRHRQVQYCIKVIRSPDGASHYYNCASLSIQECAQFILERYYTDFPTHGPYQEQLINLEAQIMSQMASSEGSSDNNNQHISSSRSRAVSPAPSSHRGGGRRSTSRASHHHHHHRHNRSPSRSPSRSRSKSNLRVTNQTNHIINNNNNLDENQMKLQQQQQQQQQYQQNQHMHQQQQLINEQMRISAGYQLNNHLGNGPQSNNLKFYQLDPNVPIKHQDGTNIYQQQQQHQLNGDSSLMQQQQQQQQLQQAQPATVTNPFNNDFNSQQVPILDNQQQQQQQQQLYLPNYIRSINGDSINLADSLSTNITQSPQHLNLNLNLNSPAVTTTVTAMPVTTTLTSKTSILSPRSRHEEFINARDETESVRSVRSRKSTRGGISSQHHHNHDKHHSHHGGHQSSSASQQGSSSIIEEHERKLRKCKYHLIMAVEDSFNHIRRVSVNDQVHLLTPGATNNTQHQLIVGGLGINGAPTVQAPMEPHEAARSIYPTMAKALQKYLKFTKQLNGNGHHHYQTKHTLNSIYDHLTNCLRYDLSPRTFLERFFQFDPPYQQSEIDIFRSCGFISSSGSVGNNNVVGLIVGDNGNGIAAAATATTTTTTGLGTLTNNNHSNMGMQNILAATAQQQHDKYKDLDSIALNNNNNNNNNNNKIPTLINSWGLISDVLLSRTIQSGTVFMLRQGEISLLVTVGRIPKLNITEEIIDPKSNKFLFKMNSETSV